VPYWRASPADAPREAPVARPERHDSSIENDRLGEKSVSQRELVIASLLWCPGKPNADRSMS
jgi:hypothetical protein